MANHDGHIGDARILEVSTSLAGAFAGQFATGLGATVRALRAEATRPREAWLDDGKAVTVAGSEQLRAAAIEAAPGHDAVIWDDTYGHLGAMPPEIRDQVSYSVELAGSHHTRGPWSEATLLAESGLAHLTGHRDGPPIPLPGHPVAMFMGAHGFAALASAVANAAAPGPAAHQRIAAVELLAGFHQFGLIDYLCNGRERRRNGRRWSNSHPIGCPTACLDGYVAVCPTTPDQFFRFGVMLGEPGLSEDPRFQTPAGRLEHADDIDARMEQFFATRTREELFATANELGVPLAPLMDPEEVLADPNLEARGFWRASGGIRVPDLGLTALPSGSVQAATPGPKRLPLEGLRVVEFSKVWAGPLAGRALADLGAEVVRIESPWSRGPAVIPPGTAVGAIAFPNDDPGERPWNRLGMVNIVSRSRKSVCLDIKDARGREIAQQLCQQSDVIVDNNRPGALDRSGLGYEAVSAGNPGVVFVEISGYGADSAYRDYPAYGPVTEAMAGIDWLIRDPRAPDVPLQSGMGLPDPIIAAFAAARVAAGLNRRHATGRGEFIDLSQIECVVTFLGDVFAEWQQTGEDDRGWEIAGDPANHAVAAPEGRYLVTTASEASADAPDQLDGTLDPRELRTVGVAAAWDNSPSEVLKSEQLRDLWIDFDHPDVGNLPYDGNPILTTDGRSVATRFPSLGEHNREVITSWLDRSASEAAELEADGVLLTVPQAPSAGV
ncbi:MAG TPA: CoA transferase [Dehalococcoidia bacterium]|nr:CoA transferase [Dehalococcoidia bacterium]